MAMAGPCSVPGEAWASPCWLGSSARWPRHSTLLGHPYKNPDKKMGLCDLGESEERLWEAQPGQSGGLTPGRGGMSACGEQHHSCGNTSLWDAAAASSRGHRHCK